MLVAGTAVVSWMGALLAACGGRVEEPARVPRIILVTIDALRSDRLGAYGYTAKPTSPNIDAFAKETILFERAVSEAPWTLPSMSTVFTGFHAIEAGTYTNRARIRPDAQTLAELLHQKGFHTASFVSHPLLASKETGFRRGFDEVFPDAAQLSRIKHDKVPFAQIEPMLMNWLDQHSRKRFFLWIHDMDTHDPPTEGNPYLKEDGWKGYPGEVRWMDEFAGRLVAKLRALGLWDEVLFIFTADHGEAFDDHNVIGHQNVLYDEALRVPLLIRYPGIAPRRIAEPVSLIDLFPTIAEFAGLQAPKGIRGESLIPILKEPGRLRTNPYLFHSRWHFEGSYHKLAVRDRDWKLLVTTPDQNLSNPPTKDARENRVPQWDLDAEATKLELFDLRQDPGEKSNVAAGHPDVAGRLLAVLRDWQQKVAAPLGEGRPPVVQMDPSTHEALRALGYD